MNRRGFMLAAGAALAGVAVAGVGEAAPATSAADAPGFAPTLKAGSFTLSSDGSGEYLNVSLEFVIEEWHTGERGEIVIDRARILTTGTPLNDALREEWQRSSVHTFIYRPADDIPPAGKLVSRV